MTKTVLAAFVVFASLAYGQGRQSEAEHWIATWAAAPQLPTPPGQARAGAFSGAFNNQTVRMIVHTSIGGHRVRVALSNAFGAAPLTIGAAHVALRAKDSAIAPNSDRALLFNGKPSCSIPVGAFLISDPVDLDVPKLSDLAVSVYVPGDTGLATAHSVGLHTTWITKSGDATAKPEIADAITTQSWYWLTRVEVLAPASTASLVTLGDSITDGTRSTPDTNGSWPAFLAARLQATPATSQIAVLNEGISGNRVLRDGTGPSALERFDRDVLSEPGVKWMTVLEGINDVRRGTGTDLTFGPNRTIPPSEWVTPDELIGAYKQIIDRAHEHGIKVFGATLLPCEGASLYTEHGNETRMSVNQWIRTGGAFDGVIDFDAVTKDAANPNHYRPDFDSGDHLHPNNVGYKAMADSINLALLANGKPKKNR